MLANGSGCWLAASKWLRMLGFRVGEQNAERLQMLNNKWGRYSFCSAVAVARETAANSRDRVQQRKGYRQERQRTSLVRCSKICGDIAKKRGDAESHLTRRDSEEGVGCEDGGRCKNRSIKTGNTPKRTDAGQSRHGLWRNHRQ